MQKIILGSFAAALLLTGCNSASDKVNSNFEKAYSSVKEEYAPDGRTKGARLAVFAQHLKRAVILHGTQQIGRAHV